MISSSWFGWVVPILVVLGGLYHIAFGPPEKRMYALSMGAAFLGVVVVVLLVVVTL